MKRIQALIDRMWKSWDSLFDGFKEAVEEDMKELEAAPHSSKTVTTESRDGFTYKTTTIKRTFDFGEPHFTAREVARAIARCYDNDNWVTSRLSFLRSIGEDAKARVVWTKRKDGTAIFSVMVRRADGRVETEPPVQN